MQTFMPYSSFEKTAKVLDSKRLCKQRVECKQILGILVFGKLGWRHHPAVKMWRGYEYALCNYALAICDEWLKRGNKDTTRHYFVTVRAVLEIRALKYNRESELTARPSWLRNPQFLNSHRSNLMRKNPEWYGQYRWRVSSDLPYVWP